MNSNPHKVIDLSYSSADAKFDGALLRVGEYVNYDNGQVGQIVSLKQLRDVSRNELRACNLARTVYGHHERELVLIRRIKVLDGLEGRPSSIDYPHILPTLKEAIPLCELEWKCISCVTNIVFLFQMDSIQEGTYQRCNGMVNAFFVRRRLGLEEDATE